MRLPSSNKPQNLLYRYKWSPITQIPTLSTWLIKNIHFKINKYIKSRYIPFDFINRSTLILKRIVTNLPLVIGEKAVTCQLTTCVKGLPGVGQGWSTRDWSWGFEQPVLVIGSRRNYILRSADYRNNVIRSSKPREKRWISPTNGSIRFCQRS